MVKLNNFGQQPNQSAFNQTDNSQFQSQPAYQQTSEPNQASQPKGLISLPPALLHIIPWIPFALEAMTGQKIPQIGGTIAEIQSSLQQVQFSLTQLLTQQSQLLARLNSLENNASHQLTNLSQQVANTNSNFKLLATETKRSLEFNPPPQLERHETEYN